MEWTNEELQAIVDEHALVLFIKHNAVFLIVQLRYYNNLVNHSQQSIF